MLFLAVKCFSGTFLAWETDVKGHLRILFALAILPATVGCATIVSGTTSKVTVRSNPPAYVVIKDRHGKEVAATQTPSQIELRRGFFRPARYTAVVEAPGYAPKKIDMKYEFNAWSIGNILIGGIPGLIIDDATGAMFTPEHEMYSVNLRPNFQASPGAYSTMPNPGPNRMPGGQQKFVDQSVQQVSYQNAAPSAR